MWPTIAKKTFKIYTQYYFTRTKISISNAMNYNFTNKKIKKYLKSCSCWSFYSITIAQFSLGLLTALEVHLIRMFSELLSEVIFSVWIMFYSQGGSSVPPKILLMNRLSES